VALFVRERLGIGQEVYTSLFNSGVWALAMDIQGALLTTMMKRRPTRDRLQSPAKFLLTKDTRWIMLNHIQPDVYWHGFCQAIERPELENDSRFDSIHKKSENCVALIKIMTKPFAKRTFEEWKARLNEFGLIFSRCKAVEVVNDPQARANNFFQTINYPGYGPIELVAAPIKFGETPGALRTAAQNWGSTRGNSA